MTHSGANGTTNWTMNILRNQFLVNKTSTASGITYSVGVGAAVTQASPNCVTNVQDNIMTGFDYPIAQSSATNWLYRAISVETANCTQVINVDHNSINMENQPNGPQVLGGATPTQGDPNGRLNAISFFNAGGFAGTFNFRNNIVRFLQQYGTVISTKTASTAAADALDISKLNFSNNTYYYNNTGIAFAKIWNGTALVTYNTLADWQAAGKDAGSNEANPVVGSGGGKWISINDLHFDADPGSAFQTATSVGVTLDVDNQVRPNGALEKGADEFYLPSGVWEWSLY
jgi:hypothetical protein